MPASVKTNQESGYSSTASRASSSKGHSPIFSRIRQTNLMDFFFNSKENKNNNEVVSDDLNLSDSDKRKNDKPTESLRLVKDEVDALKKPAISITVLRSHRQSLCIEPSDLKEPLPVVDNERISTKVSFKVETVKEASANVLFSKPTERKKSADKTKLARRRSRRQSIYVEKENFKKLSRETSTEEIQSSTEVPDVPTNEEIQEKGVSLCATNSSDDEELSVDPFRVMLIQAASGHPKKFSAVNNKRPLEIDPRSTTEIKQSAKRQKINETKFEETDPPANDPAIVEEIIEDIWYVSVMTFDKEPVVRFLVKWEGFPPSDNTLEPFEHVSHAEILKEYVNRKFEAHQDKIDEAVDKLAVEAKGLFETYHEKAKSFIMKKLAKFDVLHFRCNILAYIYTYDKIPQTCLFLRHLRSQCVLYKFFEKSDKEQKSNKLFLSKIMKKEKNLFKVTAENRIDYDALPQFEYLRNVDFPKKLKSKSGCECEVACNESANCCPNNMGVKPVYDSDGLICARSHQMIVECNDFCACEISCPNRPKRTKFNLCVFKTADRGWALKTLVQIPAGTFVIEYTGELINMAEAKKRTRVYKKLGITYLFDLDYNEKNEATYSLDATHKGNLSRFINHACNANLQTWPAISCNDAPETHRLYYFSLRTIKAGEELTVDYSGGVIRPKMNPPKDAIPCKCNAEKCRGYIF